MNNSDYTGSNSEHTYSLQADFITKSSASIRIEQRSRHYVVVPAWQLLYVLLS